MTMMTATALAQPPAPLPPAAPGQPAAPIQPAPPATDATTAQVVPALTPVVIEIGAELGSAISQTGEHFPITLKLPIRVDGRDVVPAGAKGQGEVVWAKRAGGSGAPGELVLAVRWLDIGGRSLKLRSLDFRSVGDSRYAEVNRLLIVSAATIPVASLIGFAIKGKDTLYPAGTVAGAKTAVAFDLGAVPPAPAESAASITAAAVPALAPPASTEGDQP